MMDRSDAALVLAPQIVKVDFALAPALNVLDSLVSLVRVEKQTSYSEWVSATAALLSPELRTTHKLVFWGLSHVFYDIDYNRFTSFPLLIEHVAAQDSYRLRDQILEKLCSYPAKMAEPGSEVQTPDPQNLIADVNVYLEWVKSLYQDEEIEVEYEIAFHRLISDPPQMLQAMVGHMKFMWENHMRAEWERVEPSLRATIAAYEKLDFGHMTAQEAIRAVTGREIPFKWGNKLHSVERITFIPSAHLGPFLVILSSDEPHLRILFGARRPKEIFTLSSTMGRSELLVRLNALADDTRLRILELLTQEAEVCAQDIITRLELSQSSASRHLSQLAATGYVNERRRDVAKCYSLNTDRIEQTLSALAAFLKRK